MTLKQMPGSPVWRVRRYVPGVGTIEKTLRTSKKGEARYRESVIVKLVKAGALEALRMFKDGRLTIDDLIDADRHNRLERVADDFLLQKRLGDAVEAWLPVSADALQSRRRYETSWRKFQRIAVDIGQLKPDSVVRDLTRVDYERLYRAWGASDSDWNRARAMVSSFLTNLTGHVYSPSRLEVMARFKARQEPEGRVPDATPEQFWSIVANAVDHAKASFVAMAVLGCGPKEYLAIEPKHLNAEQLTVMIPGSKNVYRVRVVAVDPRLWQWIEQAIPSKLQYRWLNEYWKRACRDAGVEGLRMYDLRHLSAQYAGDRGVTDRDLTTHLGHSNPKMSHRYSRRRLSRGIAVAIADELVGEGQYEGQEVQLA